MKISRRKFLVSSFFGLGAVGFNSFIFERLFVEVKEYDLGILDRGVKPLKMIQVSDLHLRDMNWGMKNLAQKIKNLNADVIFFTGDSIDDWRNQHLLEEFLEIIGDEVPKFSIMGNREYWGYVHHDNYKKVWERHNARLLINESVVFSCEKGDLLITGIDDRVAGNSDFLKAIENVKPNPNHIILNHSPVYREDIQQDLFNINLNKEDKEQFKPDYILSGHTHGGQVNLFGLVPYLPIGSGRYFYGWYKDFYPHLFVSKGVGTSVLPIRFGARAEIVVFNYYLK